MDCRVELYLPSERPGQQKISKPRKPRIKKIFFIKKIGLVG